MRTHEVRCFRRELDCHPREMKTCDLITSTPSEAELAWADAVLIGGSGDYSVVEGGSWLRAALSTFERLYETRKPTFASCWGFQAFARALGGKVVTDPTRAELGTIPLQLTAAGQRDPVFGALGTPFLAQMGHQDIVDSLPEGAVLLASSDRVENEAYTFAERPIYCSQFHPELTLEDLLCRVRSYPSYVQDITGLSINEFIASCQPTPGTSSLLERFTRQLRASDSDSCQRRPPLCDGDCHPAVGQG
jgi:GMP synthase (glutamine-hydrolysing)